MNSNSKSQNLLPLAGAAFPLLLFFFFFLLLLVWVQLPPFVVSLALYPPPSSFPLQCHPLSAFCSLPYNMLHPLSLGNRPITRHNQPPSPPTCPPIFCLLCFAHTPPLGKLHHHHNHPPVHQNVLALFDFPTQLVCPHTNYQPPKPCTY